MPDRSEKTAKRTARQDIVARLDGLVVALADDRIVFDPVLVRRDQFPAGARRFRYRDRRGRQRQVPLAPGTRAFLVGKVLIVVHATGPRFVVVVLEDGSLRSQDGLRLDADTSARLLGHGGVEVDVRRVDVYLGLGSGTAT